MDPPTPVLVSIPSLTRSSSSFHHGRLSTIEPALYHPRYTLLLGRLSTCHGYSRLCKPGLVPSEARPYSPLNRTGLDTVYLPAG